MTRPAALALALCAAACGSPPPPAALPAAEDAQGAPAAPCTAQILFAAPQQGDLPVARTTPVLLVLDGPADKDAKVVVMAEDGAVDGEVLIGEHTVEFVPSRPYAPGTVGWEAIVCGAHVAGSFESGKLMHPADAVTVQRFVGNSYAFDLRGGDWQAPLAKAGLELVLRSLFGGALTVSVEGAAPDRMTVSVASARANDAGEIVTDEGGSRAVVTVETKHNPYLPVALPTFTFDVDGHAVSMRGAQLTLGLADDGTFQDTRLQAEVDVRDMGTFAGRGACDLVSAYSDAVCAPCASDGKPTCFDLDLQGLSGTLSGSF